MMEINTPTTKAVFTYQEADKMWSDWLEKQPEWIAYWDEHKEIQERRQQDSMYKRGLIKPGVLLDTEKGLLLIGHINDSGGSCDDCRGIEKTDLVKRYRVVWDETKETKT
jgi:hypothetical protein